MEAPSIHTHPNRHQSLRVLRKLLVRLLVPVLDQLVQETPRLALGPAVLLCLGEFLLKMLLGFFVGFVIGVVVACVEKVLRQRCASEACWGRMLRGWYNRGGGCGGKRIRHCHEVWRQVEEWLQHGVNLPCVGVSFMLNRRGRTLRLRASIAVMMRKLVWGYEVTAVLQKRRSICRYLRE